MREENSIYDYNKVVDFIWLRTCCDGDIIKRILELEHEYMKFKGIIMKENKIGGE